MYGLPTDTDLTPFHGKELTQICIGAHQFQLHFSDGRTEDARVCVECAWKLQPNECQILDFTGETPDRVEQASWLTRLIGQSVAAAEVLPPGTLRLRFSNDWFIDIIDDTPNYEAYQISIDGKLIIV